MSLRNAINEKCRDCIHDPLDLGSAAQQIACCTNTECPLHEVRPITCKSIPLRLLNNWFISLEDLCERARPLVETSSPSSVEGQIGDLQTASGQDHTKASVEGVGL